ncbi:MAG: phage tail family protein, partial [Pseudomonadota bacterium]
MYNGIHSSNKGIYRVTDIRRSILPPITSRLLTVPSRAGAYYQGHEYGVRQIEVDIVLKEDTPAGLRERVRALAAWLKPGGEPKDLVFDDEPNLTWRAVLSGDTDLEEIATIGRGTLTFLCPDPVALGDEHVLSLGAGGEAVVTAGGTAPAWPVIKATVQQAITYLAVATPDKYVLLGRPESVEETKVPKEEVVRDDGLGSTVGWATGTQVDGMVAGTMVSTGSSFEVQSYGSGSGWHGPALKTSLPDLLQDFRVTVWLQLTNSKQSVGRAELYLLDANNAIIGKIALKDTHAGVQDMWGEARAGALSGGYYFVPPTHGDKAGVWNNFSGLFRIGRISNRWHAYFAMIDSKGRHHTRLYQEWYDAKGQYAAPLAQVQLHAGAYGTYQPMTVRFDRVLVERINTIVAGQVPYIA